MIYSVDTSIKEEITSTNYDNDEHIQSLTNNKVRMVSNYKNFEDWLCFNYALKDGDIVYCEDAFEYVEDNFKQIKFKDVKIGDLVTYHELENTKGLEKPSDWNIKHFGIISFKGSTVKRCRIESKWGGLSVFDSPIQDVPDSYGNFVCFWRKK